MVIIVNWTIFGGYILISGVSIAEAFHMIRLVENNIYSYVYATQIIVRKSGITDWAFDGDIMRY